MLILDLLPNCCKYFKKINTKLFSRFSPNFKLDFCEILKDNQAEIVATLSMLETLNQQLHNLHPAVELILRMFHTWGINTNRILIIIFLNPTDVQPVQRWNLRRPSQKTLRNSSTSTVTRPADPSLCIHSPRPTRQPPSAVKTSANCPIARAAEKTFQVMVRLTFAHDFLSKTHN